MMKLASKEQYRAANARMRDRLAQIRGASGGDSVSTMPVGKPTMLNPQAPSTGGVMPPPPLPGKGTTPVGTVPNTRGPMTPPPAGGLGGGTPTQMIAKGGKAKEKKYASGGTTASKRADGIAKRGKTKCKMY